MKRNSKVGFNMTKDVVAKVETFNVGENLDSLMNLDPRGYGVCRILYNAAREYTKEPLTMNSAKKLVETPDAKIKEGISKEEADSIAQKLKDVQAEVEVK